MWKIGRPGEMAAMLSISASAWIAIMLGHANGNDFGVCTASTNLLRRSPLADVGGSSVTELTMSTVLMLVAMMSPLLTVPLTHVRERSFASRGLRASALFVFGYMGIWLSVAMLMQGVSALLAQFDEAPVSILGLALAVIWQISPLKQRAMNGCHRMPALAAHGRSADRDTFLFGVTHGLWCVGACWALMLVALLSKTAQPVPMLALAFFLIAERFEGSARTQWALRIPLKLLRAGTHRVRGRPDGLLRATHRRRPP